VVLAEFRQGFNTVFRFIHVPLAKGRPHWIRMKWVWMVGRVRQPRARPCHTKSHAIESDTRVSIILIFVGFLNIGYKKFIWSEIDYSIMILY